MQTDRVSARKTISATATFYSATYIVLYTHHSTIAQRTHDAIHGCHQHTTNLVDVNWTVTVIIRFNYHHSC